MNFRSKISVVVAMLLLAGLLVIFAMIRVAHRPIALDLARSNQWVFDDNRLILTSSGGVTSHRSATATFRLFGGYTATRQSRFSGPSGFVEARRTVLGRANEPPRWLIEGLWKGKRCVVDVSSLQDDTSRSEIRIDVSC